LREGLILSFERKLGRLDTRRCRTLQCCKWRRFCILCCKI